MYEIVKLIYLIILKLQKFYVNIKEIKGNQKYRSNITIREKILKFITLRIKLNTFSLRCAIIGTNEVKIVEIALKTDSRKVKPGDTFIAIVNVVRDGHDYIEQAIKNGAVKVIVEHGNYSVETVVVENTREYLKEYLYKNYYPLIKDMKLIGITGTNGKTTTCLMIYQILKMLKQNVAYMGTVGFYYGDVKRKMVNTTPDVDVLYSMLLEAKEAGVDYFVMEVEEKIPNARLNGSRTMRLPGNANFSFRGIDGRALVLNLNKIGICVSGGSACSSGSTKASHVLKAIGLPDEIAKSAIRITFGEENTKEDVDYLIEALQEIAEY